MDEMMRRLANTETPRVLRFSLCEGRGWIVSTDEAAVRLLCDVWNNRKAIWKEWTSTPK